MAERVPREAQTPMWSGASTEAGMGRCLAPTRMPRSWTEYATRSKYAGVVERQERAERQYEKRRVLAYETKERAPLFMPSSLALATLSGDESNAEAKQPNAARSGGPLPTAKTSVASAPLEEDPSA